jgi:predicted RNA binding protein YcfA (HicA-like mRNA interferase family)
VSPALSDVSSRQVIRALERAGFRQQRTRGSHAVSRHRDGRVAVVPLHDTVKRGTLGSILRQAQLTREEFLTLLGK